MSIMTPKARRTTEPCEVMAKAAPGCLRRADARLPCGCRKGRKLRSTSDEGPVAWLPRTS